jgi:hypothetical protein
MAEWDVFQTDVLDTVRQYEGFFDFFERIGNLSDSSRPDSVARISREDKKEIWILDAKNKAGVDDEDLERMDNYVKMSESNPLDVGLEFQELDQYDVRGIFVTNGEASPDRYEAVDASSLHQFLQKELVYTDTDRVVRDVAKMAKRKQLSQSQARMLFQSLKPFERNIQTVIEKLEEMESRHVALELKTPPLSSFDSFVPVEAVLTHRSRDKSFLIDIPYSEDELENVDEKVEQVKQSMDSLDSELYYTSISTFGSRESELVYTFEEFRREMRRESGILPPEFFADLFTPNIPTEKTYEDGYIKLEDTEGLGFRMKVTTDNDIEHEVHAVLPEEAVSRMKDHEMNSRTELGEVWGNEFRHQVRVEKGLELSVEGKSLDMEGYRDAVRSIYSSAVNPVLAKKLKHTV